MNYLITPPAIHYDGGLGVTGCHFRNAAELLKEHGSFSEGILPLCYLHRHALELFLKLLIFILHKKFSIKFGGEFSLSKPAIHVRGKWTSMENTHNISDLYTYFETIYGQCLDKMPITISWDFPEDIKSKIDVVSGADPKSTFFRYPKSGSPHQDEKKSKIQKTNINTAFNNQEKPAKLVLMFDQEDNLLDSYDLDADALSNLQVTLDYLSDFFDGVHAAFRHELTNGS
jgi:hypothetical protein